MSRASEPGAGVPPPDVTRVGPRDFAVWSVPGSCLEGGVAPFEIAADLDHAGVSAVAVNLEGLSAPTPERTGRVVSFVNELQCRGIPVVLHSVPADFLTALEIDGTGALVATRPDLSAAIDVLREYDEMRRRCTRGQGRRINQLRMPARALSLAPLCVYARGRLEEGEVPVDVALGLIRECYAAMIDVLDSHSPAAGDLALSVTVHEGRATLTLLDGGEARENEVICPGTDGRVDRIHRFRILDRHNALVLEKDLTGTVS